MVVVVVVVVEMEVDDMDEVGERLGLSPFGFLGWLSGWGWEETVSSAMLIAVLVGVPFVAGGGLFEMGAAGGAMLMGVGA